MTITDRIAGLNQGVALKAPVRVATTANITLSGEQTIDGVSVTAGDRVLVKDQTNQKENGIWVVAETAWARAKDFNGARDAVYGTLVLVTGGTEADNVWKLTTADGDDGYVAIGTANITFARNELSAGLTAAKEAAEDAQAAAEQAALDAEAARDGILNDAGFQAVSADLTGPNTIGTVAGMAVDVSALAALSTEVQAVAAALSDIATAASNITAIQAAPQAALDAQAWATKTDAPVSGGLYGAKFYAELAATYAPLNNWTGGRAPTVNDDVDAGFSRGSYWVDDSVSPMESLYLRGCCGGGGAMDTHHIDAGRAFATAGTEAAYQPPH